MEVSFASAQLGRLCNNLVTARRKLGEERAKKLQLRLDQISAATHLAELATLPQARCHQLKGDRDERFSLDLDGPHRLIVEVDHDPVPRTADGGVDREKIERLLVLEIRDTH